MKRFLVLCACLSMFGALAVGCSDTSKVQKTETTETPGGTTETTTTTEVEQSGENPPPASGTATP